MQGNRGRSALLVHGGRGERGGERCEATGRRSITKPGSCVGESGRVERRVEVLHWACIGATARGRCDGRAGRTRPRHEFRSQCVGRRRAVRRRTSRRSGVVHVERVTRLPSSFCTCTA